MTFAGSASSRGAVKSSRACLFGPMKRHTRSTPRSAASSPANSSTGNFSGGETLEDGRERGIAIDLPAERNVFVRTVAHDEAAGMGVGAQRDHAGGIFRNRHADPVRGKPLPVRKAGGVDEDVAELHSAIDGGDNFLADGRVHEASCGVAIRMCGSLRIAVDCERKAMVAALNSAARSHCTQ